jgi:hypothetical protein
MGHRVVHINLPAREPLPDFLVRQNTDAERRLTFDLSSMRSQYAGSRQTQRSAVRPPQIRE